MYQYINVRTIFNEQEEKTLALRKEGMGVILDSELPHLIGIDDDILSTGIMLYHLKEGKTRIGTAEAKDNLDISKEIGNLSHLVFHYQYPPDLLVLVMILINE